MCPRASLSRDRDRALRFASAERRRRHYHPRLIRRDEMSSFAGLAMWKRGRQCPCWIGGAVLSASIVFEIAAERQLVELSAHRHDARANSCITRYVLLRLTPADALSLQRIYTLDTILDVAITVHDETWSGYEGYTRW